MSWVFLGVVGGGAFVVGSLTAYFLRRSYERYHLQKAKEQGDRLLQEGREKLEIQEMERQELLKEIRNSAWSQKERSFQEMEEGIKQLQLTIDEKRHQQKKHWRKKTAPIMHQRQQLERRKRRVQNLHTDVQKLEKHLLDQRENYLKKLQASFPGTLEKLREQLELEEEKKSLVYIKKKAIEGEEKAKLEVKSKTKHLMDIAFNRFQRPCSTEKGILIPSLKDKKTHEMFWGEDSPYRKALEESCKCQLVVDTDKEFLQVSAGDPVRKELVRRCLRNFNKSSKYQNLSLSMEALNEVVKRQKKQLLIDISTDGKKVAKELKQATLHKEILKILGCLRYRYSFTQNQYFHVGEVGWFCGLLASELRLPVHDARRAGLLHDIGKALTHAMEGSHAVIGADFIKERGEKEEVCHPVRAHHNDETPSSPLAFLVIAADAISGGRPGARASAMESYSEKVSALEDIALRCQGVKSCYVLNGGREIHVFNDSENMSDEETIALSQDIAQALEKERHIPNKIKVVVLRKKILQTLTQEKKVVHNKAYR